MQAIHFIAITSALWCLTSAKMPIGPDKSLTYECTNTTVIISGKNATNYGSIFALGTNANNKSEECGVSRTTQNASAKFEISGCEVTKPITIIMMQERQKWTQHDMVIGGQLTAKYELLCNDVYLGGVTMKKTFNLSKVEDMKADKDHQPIFTLNMTMQTADHKGLNNAVLIGTDLLLVITGTHGFRMYTQSCVARSFPDATGHQKPLITNGVADDPMIMTNFSDQTQNKSNNETDIIEAHLYAFHFLESDTIYVECTITVCQNDDNSCPALSSSTTNVPTPTVIETSSTKASTTKTTATTVTSTTTKSANGGRRKRNVGNSVPQKHTVRTTLRVFDNNVVIENTPVSSSASRVSSLLTASTFIYLALQVARP